MTGEHKRAHDASVRFESLDTMPAARPLSAGFKLLSDGEIDRRASEDPDAGPIPVGFWDDAEITDPNFDDWITLRPDTVAATKT